jgi:large subunit ribosomal protein L15
MANELSNLQPVPGSRKARIRVGRGEGSGKGKTAGRGQNGQRARGQVARGFEGGQMPLSRRLPKRGFKNPFSKEYTEVRVDRIDGRFSSGEVVDAAALKDRGIVSSIAKDGVKVLGNGEITVAVTVRAAAFSEGARAKIVAAGGSCEDV